MLKAFIGRCTLRCERDLHTGREILRYIVEWKYNNPSLTETCNTSAEVICVEVWFTDRASETPACSSLWQLQANLTLRRDFCLPLQSDFRVVQSQRHCMTFTRPYIGYFDQRQPCKDGTDPYSLS